MRLIGWGLVVVGLAYLGYTGMLATWSWIAVNNAVDEVVSKDGVDVMPSREIKAEVMTAVAKAGVPLSDKDVQIRNADQGVSVEVLWTVPVVVMNGDPVFAVPLTVRRTSGSGKR